MWSRTEPAGAPGSTAFPSAGKTGTTNNYRDAWFMGYTGNFVGGVWFGNDDYAPMKSMTGGSIPAQTWHQIMAYAHQGIELKPIPGVDMEPASKALTAAANASGSAIPVRPPTLSQRGAEVLVQIEKLLEQASHDLAVSDRGRPAPRADAGPNMEQQRALASVMERGHAAPIRGD